MTQHAEGQRHRLDGGWLIRVRDEPDRRLRAWIAGGGHRSTRLSSSPLPGLADNNRAFEDLAGQAPTGRPVELSWNPDLKHLGG